MYLGGVDDVQLENREKFYVSMLGDFLSDKLAGCL